MQNWRFSFNFRPRSRFKKCQGSDYHHLLLHKLMNSSINPMIFSYYITEKCDKDIQSLNDFEEGDIVRGYVKAVTDVGVFVRYVI